MLKVKVELVPYGKESDKKLLEKLVIVNTGQHPESPEKGNYLCYHNNGIVKINDHTRDHGYWPLIQKCIQKMHKGLEKINDSLTPTR